MTMRRPIVRATAAFLVLLCAACIEFADPLIPFGTSPAQFSATMRVFDNGIFQVDGALMPGTDSAGFQRPVESPFIAAAGFTIEPTTLGARGQRNYTTTLPVPRNWNLPSFRLSAPVVRGVGVLPDVEMIALQREGPDTLYVAAGSDISLRFATGNMLPAPTAPFRQWFVEVRGAFNTFRISSDGIPPTTLRLPVSGFIPATTQRADVSLVYFQSMQVRSPTNQFIGSVVLDQRMAWVVQFVLTP